MTSGVATGRALAGRLVVVTRAREQAGRFAALLEQEGAQVLVVPTIAIEPPGSWAPLDEALGHLGRYRWAIFTSVNGVEMVRSRWEAAGRPAAALGAIRLAAIGPATARALEAWGLRAEIVPDEYVAESLAARLRPVVRPGDRVLLARAAEARDVLVRQLEALGATVDEVPAYRTRPATEGAESLRQALVERRVDVVAFTSSSTVRHFAALFPAAERERLMRGVTVACIGPITRATAAELGLPAHVMPDEYTIPALVRAIAAHFRRS